MNESQLGLFGPERSTPEGFKYQRDVLSPELERATVERFAGLDFKPFEFRGYEGNRRVISFGWRYDFAEGKLQRAGDIPAFLLPLRDAAAAFAALPAADLAHVLLTEYGAGAGIGWHKDRPVFGDVIGISLLSPCTFRFRRRSGGRWERASIVAEPRSAYLLSGPARTEWEHSIPALEALRYSVTFRTLRPELPGSA